MNLTKSFAEILRQKITIGSTRSILLNALPGRMLTRLALTDLDLITPGLSAEFIEELTEKKSFSFRFSLDTNNKTADELKQLSRIQKRIAAIKYEHDDYLSEHGVETFAFGFPLIVRRLARDQSKVIVSPLFIFHLDIKQSFDKTRHWVISRSQEAEVKSNEVLISYLEGDEHIKIPSIPDEMLEDGILSKEEINTLCKKFLEKFEPNSDGANSWTDFEKLPDKIDASYLKNCNTKIVWNGVFGLYKSQKQSQVKEMEALIENYDSMLPTQEKFEWENSHSPVTTDPSQNYTLRSLATERHIIIQGPPGTGKSKTLTAIILGALANNKKILVVCEKRTALDVLKNNLVNEIPELANAIAVIEDISRDRTQIVNTVRNRTARLLVHNHQKSILHDDIIRFEEKANKIDNQYRALRTPIWRNKKWKDLVSSWIAEPKNEKQIDELFLAQKMLSNQSLNDSQFASIVAKIQDAEPLFTVVENHFEFFESHITIPKIIKPNYDREIISELKNCRSILKELLASLYILKTNFIMLSEKQNTSVIDDCKNQISEFNKIISDPLTKQFDLFSLPNYFSILSIFSRKHKIAQQNAERIKILWRKISLFWESYLDEKITPSNLNDKLSFLEKDVKNILATRTISHLEQPINSIQSICFDKEQFEKIYDSAKKVEDTIGAFLANYKAKQTTNTTYFLVENKLRQLYNALEQIIDLENPLREYITWKAFQRNLSSSEEIWINFLIGRKKAEWSKYINDAWLYHKLITEDNQDRFPTDENTINSLKQLQADIRKQQYEIIKTNIENWFISGQQDLKSKNLLINQVYNLRGAKGNTRNSLRKIAHTSLSSFTSFFPVLMVNPGTCASILPIKKGFFDLVIYDEASQLRIEDTFPSMLRGKQIVVSGDSQQMPPSSYFETSNQLLDDDNSDEESFNENTTEDALQAEIQNDYSREMAMTESLLQFAIDSDFRQTYLNMHYRSQHPDLIEFSNVCFYGGRLIPMPAKENQTPISYKNIKGRYEKRQNEDEAREIIRLLKDEIQESVSVGVATFNLTQRNLILDLINEERTVNDGFQRKMEEFEKNGFFVKNLENIQGDERDIIIISTTFGVKENNSFTLGFGPISQKNGHRLLNVIITRAKLKVYVITSIPETKIQEFRARIEINRKVDGTTGLLAYLAYAKAVSENVEQEKLALLDFIKNKIAIGQSTNQNDYLNFTESPFEEEVASWLYESIDKERIILQYKCGGFRIDMVVLPKDPSSNRKLAIECDGAAYHAEELAWHYDMYRQQQLESHGFIFHRIWSTNWWRKPDVEFQNLLKAIDALN